MIVIEKTGLFLANLELGTQFGPLAALDFSLVSCSCLHFGLLVLPLIFISSASFVVPGAGFF